jgi:transposase
MGDDVMISVDPHKASNTRAVMDPVTKTVIARQRFANTAVGYRRLREFAGGWTHRRWAVEGCHGAGRSLAQRLIGDGEIVLDVPANWPLAFGCTRRGTAARPTPMTRSRSVWLR